MRSHGPDATVARPAASRRRAPAVAVLAEGYSQRGLSAFDRHFGTLQEGLSDCPPLGGLTLTPVRVASNESPVPTGAGPPGDTAFRTVYNGDPRKAWVTLDGTTNDLIRSALSGYAVAPSAVVLMNVQAEAGMCDPATGHVFLARNAPAHVLAHEFGHQLGGLYDEYFIRDGCQGRLTRHDRNCSETRDPARVPWAARLTGAPLEGCNGCTRGAWRPTNACRMGMDTTRPFCPVCSALLDDALAAWEPVPLLRVLCRLRPEGMQVLGSYPGSGAAPDEFFQSRFVATAEVRRDIVWLAGLAGDPFLRRGLMPARRGRGTGHAFHRMSEGDFVLDLPVRVAETAADVALYRLPESFFQEKTLTTAEARRAIAQNGADLVGRAPLPRNPDARR